MQVTRRFLKSQHKNDLRRSRPAMYKYRELTRWQREAQGISKWDQSHSHRPLPYAERFNPESVGLTKGTSRFAWKWWHTHYPWLPNVPPPEYRAPRPLGLLPPAWREDDEFSSAVLAMSDDEIRQYLMDKFTDVIFAESQRDGYELRRVDFEGNPLTSRPEPSVIKKFVFEEDTLRERVIQEVVENIFRLSPTSEDRKELRSVEIMIDYVLTHVTFAREPPVLHVTEAAKSVMRSFPVQPVLGFEHALPTDNRDQLLKDWEGMHHSSWQFGNAVYVPRTEENIQGNMTWLREEHNYEDRQAFQKWVDSGKAREEHLAKIRAAAKNGRTSSETTMR